MNKGVFVFKKICFTLAALVVTLAMAAVPVNAESGSWGFASTEISPIVSDAVTPQATCSAGYLCVWVNRNFGGAKRSIFSDDSDWSNNPQSQCRNGTWSDCASTAWNNGNFCDVQLWNLPNYRNQALLVERGEIFTDLSAVFFNDAATSNLWVNC
jgi:hypothetical protein